MKLLLAFLLFTYACIAQTIEYPYATQSKTVNEYHGVKVNDPYQWMEDPENPELIIWLEEQEELKKAFYKKELRSTRYLQERIEILATTEGNRFETSGPYFFQQFSLYESNSASLFISESPRKQGMLLVNPYRFSKNEELLSIADYIASPDGKYIAVAFSSHGSDWNTIRIFPPNRSKALDDKVIHVKAQFSTLTWIGDGFVYARFKSKGLSNKYLNQTNFERLYYHKIGTSQEEDLPLDKEYFKCEASADQNEILLYRLAHYANQSTLYIDRMYLSELESTEINPIRFLSMDIEDQIDFRYIGTFDDGHCFLTNYQAPKYQVIYCDTSLQNKAELMERSDTSVIENAIVFNNKLVTLNYFKGAHFVDVIDGDETIRYPVGEGASVRWKGVDPFNNIIFLSVTRFFLPSVDYQLNINTGKVDMIEQLTTSFKFENYKTEYIEYKSKDGTLIPMYLTHKRSLEKDGKTPVLMYAYGGFGLSTKPEYDASFALWLEHGGILAVPLVRGGGELGKDWHDAGKLLNKQNCIDDFIYAAEYLISGGYTSNDKIGIIGGSNGGLVIATAFTQRPDLFGVAVVEAGVLDMLRYELFTVGNQYVREYGSINEKVEFENLYNYSPLHNLEKGKDYPTVLLTAALFDDRVPPHHSHKFLAQLQHCDLPNEHKPSLIYIEERGGHSGEATPEAYFTKKAFIMGFLFKNLGIKFRKN